MEISQVSSKNRWFKTLRISWLVFALLVLAVFIAGMPLQASRLSSGYYGMMSSAGTKDVQVLAVFKGLPADRAIIRVGDRITAINGAPILLANGLMDLHYWVRGLSGPQVEFTLADPQGRLRSVRVDNQPPSPLPFGLPASFFAWGAAAWDLLFILGYLLLGAVIVARAREDPFAVLLAYLLALIAIRLPGEISLSFIAYLGWNNAPSFVNSLGYLVIPLALSLFPNGRWHPRWIWVYPLAGLVLFGLSARSLSNPLDFSEPARFAIDPFVTAAGLAAQVHRYFTVSTPLERQQTKWALFGIAAGFVGYYLVIFAYSYNVLPGVFPGLVATTGSSYLYALGQRIYFIPMLVIAVALAFSILRYRLWDVDLIIRRTLVYTLTLAGLAGVYLGSVILLAQLFRPLTGQSNLAVVISTLTIVILFSPLQRLVRRVVDRRFYRSRYDAALILATFAAASRSQVDLNQLTGELTRAVDQAMMPESISLWLKPVEKRS